MDFTSVYTYIQEECGKGGPLLLYVGIGCSLEHYPPGKHPQQQYPPYLREFLCQQICVLIDPRLEMPPRVFGDFADIRGDVTILPIVDSYNHTSQYGDSTAWFLESLAKLCTGSGTRVQMIVQEYTGTDIQPFYPLRLGIDILKNVLYDPTYGCCECACSPNFSAIFRDAEGGFIQPAYTPLYPLRSLVPRDVFLVQYRKRVYPIVGILSRLYKNLRGIGEVMEWCTVEKQAYIIQYYSFIYGVSSGDTVIQLRRLLIEVVKDICAFRAWEPMSQEGIVAIVDSPGEDIRQLLDSVVV